MNRVKERYVKQIIPALMKANGYANVHEVPKIDKVVLDMRLGDVKDNTKSINLAVEELGLIAGQKPIVTVAKKAIANFKIHDGNKVGAKVTLRGEHMYEFIDKLVSIALPRVRDFKGLSKKSFDGRGNYAMGVKEHIIFPEISYEKIEKIRGFDIQIVTTAKTDKEALQLLTEFGFPFAE
jgi:large subunit ribosomal protein L5